MRRELELFQPALAAKPQIVAANKIDAVDDDRRASTALEQRATELGLPFFRISGVDRRRRARAARSDVAAARGRARPPRTRPARHDAVDDAVAGASACSAARSIRFTAATSTSARAARAALGLTRAARHPGATCRRTGRSRSRRASTGSRWWRWRSPDARAGARRTSSCARDGAVVHGGHARAVPRARVRAVASCSSSSAPTRSQKSPRGSDYPAILDRAHFVVVSRPGLPGRRRCRDRLPELARADGAAAARRGRADASPSIISDRCADAPTCRPLRSAQRARAGRVDRRPGAAGRRSNTLSSTDFTRRRRRADARATRPRRQRQAGCMAKTEKRRKADAASRRRSSGRSRAAETRRPIDVVVLDLRKAAGFTDFFVICSGTNARQVRAIADAVDGGARRRTASSRRTSKATTAPSGSCSTTSTSSSTSSRRRRGVFYGLERLWGNAERVELVPPASADAALSRRGRARPRLLDGLAAPSCWRRRAPRAASRSTSRRGGPVCGACWRVDPCRSRRRSATRCGDPLPSLARRQPSRSARCPRCRARAPPRRRPRARRSAPTTARCARSSTRSSTTGGDRWRAPLGRADARAAAPTCSTAPTASCRCRCTRRGAAQRGFNQAARSRARISGCRSCRALRRVRATRDADRPAGRRSATATCAARSRRRGARRALAGDDRRAGRRCEHDGRDAGGVRARADGGGRARGARAYGGASRDADRAERRRRRSPSFGPLAVEHAPSRRAAAWRR